MTLYSLFENNTNNRVVKCTLVLLMNCMVILLLILWTMAGVLVFPIGFVFMKFFLGYSSIFLTRKCIWIYGKIWQLILSPFVIFIPPKVHGNPFKVPGIIVVNHRSFFDTYCMNMIPTSDICFAVRAWPFKIPLYNIFMKLAGYINIENYSWDKTLAVSKENFKNKSHLLFFPEGHRSKDNNMTRFFSGAFKLAIENNVPIIPVCLTGTETLLPPDRCYMMPAKIKMNILDPVFPEQFKGDMKHIQLRKHVKNMMEIFINQMEKDYI